MNSATGMTTRLVTLFNGFLVSAGLFILAASGPLSAETASIDLSSKHLLLLYSYHPTFPTAPQVREGLHIAFDGTKPPVIDLEYMDTKRHFSADGIARFKAFLEYKLANRPAYDLIMTADDNALNFVLQNRSQLFPGVPVVFLGVNNRSLALQQNDTADITGVIEATSAPETLELAQQMSPDMQSLHIIVDSTPSGQGDLKTLMSIADQFPQIQFNPISLESLTWDAFTEELNRLPSDDVALLLSAYTDRNDRRKTFDESLDLIYDNLNIPLLHLWEHGMGDGVTGGKIISHTQQGLTAGRIARTVLEGASISSFPVVDVSPNIAVFDYRELTRFSISKNQLPTNAEIRFRPPGFFEQNRRTIISFLITIVGLLIIIAFLIYQNRIRARLTASIKAGETLLKTTINELPVLFSTIDETGQYQLMNREMRRFQDIPSLPDDEILNQSLNSHSFQSTEKDKAIQQALKTHRTQTLYEEVTAPDSDQIHYLKTILKPFLTAERKTNLVQISQDLTDILKAQKKLSDNENTLRTILNNLDAYIYMKDTDGCYLFANKKVRDLFERSLEDIIGHPDKDFFDAQTCEAIEQTDRKVFSSGRAVRLEEVNRIQGANSVRYYQSTKLPLVDKDGNIYALCGISVDITSQKEHEKALMRMAHFDTLTGLPNRTLFSDRLHQAMLAAKRHGHQISVMYLDLDGFKAVNDKYGHQTGDRLLQAISIKMRSVVRANDTLARLGGDEFIAVLINDNVQDPDQDLKIVNRMLKSVEKPIKIDEQSFQLTASIGISRYPQQETIDADQLIRQADQAMYVVKTRGRNSYHFFDEDVERRTIQKELLIQKVRAGLHRGEFELWYQPKVELSSGTVIGMEALIRWREPDKGLLYPDSFLPDIENNPVINEVDNWVIHESIKQICDWCDHGLTLPVSINVSNLQLDSTGFIDSLRNTLNKFPDLPAGLLEIEIVESRALDNLVSASTIMRACHRLGINFAIDDFGTGYSSLNYLKQLPVNTLKIDKSFVQDMLTDDDDKAILIGIRGLGLAFNLNVIVEGVETIEHGQQLRDMGFSLVQGYAIARPMTAAEVPRWLKTWRAPDSWLEVSHRLGNEFRS